MIMFFGHSVFAQTKKQKEEITSRYDKQKIQQLKTDYTAKAVLEKEQANAIAQQRGWQTKFTTQDGRTVELKKVVNGKPIYYTTFNVAAAKSTRVDHLNSGGSLGLNLDGQNMTAYVWDGGVARASHQEYDGAGGSNRFSTGDSGSLNYHSAHVTGTIIASGVQANAKGMASHAQAIGYDWNSDLGEATTAASNGMLISNHSYGYAARNQQGQVQLPQYYFGGYIDDSRDWDNLMFNAPNYLMVVAAGNDGNDDTANTNPSGGFGYDKLTGHSTSKNNLVVAAANDANIDSNGNLISTTIATFSSEGPTDDFRIKPDIAGNGVSVYSTYESSDTDYNSISGTSMASPNVAGSLVLLQQHANNVNGSFMKAATLKGLALHTADDAGAFGPDVIFGWGLLNTKAAAEAITQNGNESKIEELTLTSGQTYSITVDSDGVNDLLASISWTDRAGIANTGTVNLTTPVLVNDLDIRVTKGGITNFPYELTSALTNVQQDNNVDPYERVDVTNASGTYTVTVTNKGSLTGGSQNFSLIVTGLSGTPVICNATTPSVLNVDGFGSSAATISWDAVPGASYDVRYRETGGSWIITNIAGTSTSLSGLTPLTSYEVQVRSICPDNSTSNYSSSVNFTTTEVQLNYCNSASTNISDEYIGRLQLNTIDNVSGGQFYTDFTNISTDLNKGNQYTITVTPTWTGTVYSEGYAVWIDYNKDGDFDDAGEQVWSQAATQTTPISGGFTVPSGAADGATRMRVSMKYNGIPASCETFQYGEVEDYTVNLGAGVADTIAPVIILTGSATMNLNVGDSFTDPGATASDNIDGDLTSSIVTTGAVVLDTAGTYQITYNVSDAAGNAATPVIRTVIVSEPAGDTEAPTAPSNVLASAITETTATISWNVSSDNVGVTGYNVYQGTTNIGTVTSAAANITGLAASTGYTFSVTAIDAVGNESSSGSVMFTTLSIPATCDDGIQNGDETGIDCGGSSCAPCSTGSVVLNEGFFETGWDGWIDGGSDSARRFDATRSYEGSYSIRIRDNSGTASSMTSPSFDITSFNEIEVSFYFYSRSMENGEDFWLLYNNGSGWSNIKTYTRGLDFNNNTFYSATVTLNASEDFTANSKFRFQCDASGNNDQIFIDQVTITGRSNTSNAENTITSLGGGYTTNSTESENVFEDDFKIFPNPVSGNILNVKLFDDSGISYRVINMIGQTVLFGELRDQQINVESLKSGMYFIEINDGEETQTKKFVRR